MDPVEPNMAIRFVSVVFLFVLLNEMYSSGLTGDAVDPHLEVEVGPWLAVAGAAHIGQGLAGTHNVALSSPRSGCPRAPPRGAAGCPPPSGGRRRPLAAAWPCCRPQRVGLGTQVLAAQHGLHRVPPSTPARRGRLQRVDLRGVVVGLLHHLRVGVARYPLAQRCEGYENGGEHDEDDDRDADGDKKVDARQLEGELLLEGVGVHHHEAVLVLDDIGHQACSAAWSTILLSSSAY